MKPEVAKHELLYEIEQELRVNVRFAWVMLPSQCDREGRFKWRPAPLKLDILPYDEIDFSRVLDAWLTRGLLVKYRVADEWYGWVPTFRKHQAINPRESASELPSVDEAEEVIDHRKQRHTHASGTRQARVNDASGTRHVHARGEGKGREGEDDASTTRDSLDLELDSEGVGESRNERKPSEDVTPPPGLDLESWSRWLDYRQKIRKPLKPASIRAAQESLAAFGSDQSAVVTQSIANGYQGLFELKSRNGTNKPKEGPSHARGLPILNP